MLSVIPPATPPVGDPGGGAVAAMDMLPFLRIATERGLRIPKVDLAPVIRRLCEKYWQEADGSAERLNLRLEPVVLELDRVRLLTQAVRALLAGGLSSEFSPKNGAIGVHLWPLDQPEPAAVVLIADSGTALFGDRSTPFIISALHLAEEAGCGLMRQQARGALWRIHIPLSPAARATQQPNRAAHKGGIAE
jgi:hypothetical protein